MKVYFFLALICCSCSTIKKSSSADLPCNENITFKEQFFRNVKIVDDFILLESKTEFKDIDEYEHLVTEQKIAEFKSSLNFISKYAHVSFESMANYNGSYPIGVYEEDKAGWLKWYEENKCKNIQSKK